MDSNQPYEFDWHRMFLGEHPLTYLIEIVLRVILVYSVTLTFLRWGGKRTMGELTFFDFAIIIALGTAVGDGMIFHDVPLLHSFLVVACVVGLERLVATFTQKNKTIEKIVEGEPVLIVEQGTLCLKEMDKENISRDELFESLRYDGIHHLGQVAVAYLEPSGKLSVIKATNERPGLSILPHRNRIPEQDGDDGVTCCSHCGSVFESVQKPEVCPHCQKSEWAPATRSCSANTRQSTPPTS